ncbi:hypothetical protein C8R44DRAFT_800634 [Mycena epipterygia]|nr:hypothetical protein C8R44DRAFT_800634 [Mycena epipterygia]
MSVDGFLSGPNQGNSSYYPNAIYQGAVFSAKPSLPVENDPSQANPPETNPDAPRECSVRGCLNLVEPPGPNALANKKMCAACREKHRYYSSNKRQRRKAEKALVNRLSTGTQLTAGEEAEPANWPNEESGGQADATTLAQYSPPVSTLSTSSAPQSQHPVHWSQPMIDPALYTQPSGPSSSSTLAGALTLQPPITATPNVSSWSTAAPSSSVFKGRDQEAPSTGYSQNDIGHNQSQTESTAPSIDLSASGASDPTGAGTIPQPANGRPRFCSVKGCKAIILESMEVYPYKMCQPCRTRYRDYGITKRAKWKAEREAYDKELEGLREKEDKRRADNGLPPLSDDQDELRAWELSIIDEQVPLPPSHQAAARGSVPMPMDELDERFSRQVPPEVPLPARMCTVSHCHKILPGFYRYKRCETHRIQNRWHSKLKRGREKIEKGFMLPDGTIIVPPGPIIKPKSNAEPKEKKARKKREAKGKEGERTEAASGSSTLAENAEGGEERTTEQNPNNNDKPAPKRPKSSSTCKEDDCCNLIVPGTRWRACDSCRALTRTLKQEKKAADKKAADQNRSDDMGFVNITADTPTGPNMSDSGPTAAPASGSGSSFAIVPIQVSVRPGAEATYPPGYTSTSTLLTVNEPPPAKSSQSETPGDPNQGGPTANSGVRTVRKYKKLPRYDKDTNAEASSSAATPQPIPGSHSPYPYPPYAPPPGPYPYYMAHPGYYGMPPPSGSGAPGQPPLMYMPPPYPYAMMPPPDKSGAAPSAPPGPPTISYPYYPYALPPPGYGMPQHYPRPHYAYPNSMPPHPHIPAGSQPTPYAVYKFHSTPAPPPPPPPAGASQGYTYYQFKNGLRNPPETPPTKRRRLSDDMNVAVEGQQQAPIARLPTPRLDEDRAASPVHTPVAPLEEAAPSVPMDAEVRDEEQRPPTPQASSQRVCGSKTCNRALPSDAGGPLCEKCRTKMKKRQAMTKQRFRLEPKKIVATKSTTVSTLTQPTGGDDTMEP